MKGACLVVLTTRRLYRSGLLSPLLGSETESVCVGERDNEMGAAKAIGELESTATLAS